MTQNNKNNTPIPDMKPCPFCGADARLFIRNRQYSVICSNHFCIGHDIEPHFTVALDAALAWNKRKTHAEEVQE